ncbi:NUDIX hydrolase [Candidatus Woesearchaeota archaeon]|nr:NUDIX hydrolase [Candidatus Woesearchaeota archaeon]
MIDTHFIGIVAEYVLIENEEEKYLFLEWAKNTKFNGTLHLPGGRSDFEDEAGKTAIRELKEEINLDKEDLLDIKPFFLKKTFNNYPKYSIIFKIKIKKESEQKIKILEKEYFTKIHWLTKEEIINMSEEKFFLNFTKEMIEKI